MNTKKNLIQSLTYILIAKENMLRNSSGREGQKILNNSSTFISKQKLLVVTFYARYFFKLNYLKVIYQFSQHTLVVEKMSKDLNFVDEM